MTSPHNPQKTAEEIAEEKRLKEKADKEKAEADARLQASVPEKEIGFWDMIADFLKFIFGIVFGKEGEPEAETGESVGDPNAKPLTAVEKMDISRKMVAANMGKKWHDYKAKHAGETVELHSPVAGKSVVTSAYGKRVAPKPGASTDHKGIDVVVTHGSNKVLAAEDGIVLFSDRAGNSGITLTIGHADGSTTVYRHLKNLAELPKLGTEVKQGQVVATIGNTGISTNPHLHFEHRDVSDVPRNPKIIGVGAIAKGTVIPAGLSGDARYASLTSRDAHPKLSVGKDGQPIGQSITSYKPHTPAPVRG